LESGLIERTRLLPRPDYVRDARLFVIAVEGAEQEPWYFYGLERSGCVPPRRVRLEVLSDETRSAPEHVAARLGAWETEHRLIASDERWLVVDVDRHHNLQTTLAEAARIGWRVAVSNPCFEVWLQLHFADVASGGDSAACKAAWGALRKDRPEKWPFDRVAVERACARAEAGATAGGWVPPVGGTTVFRTVRSLLGAAR
jgi:hypothetical protein